MMSFDQPGDSANECRHAADLVIVHVSILLQDDLVPTLAMGQHSDQLPPVPEGTSKASSAPNFLAAISCNRLTVGSSRSTSSPSPAPDMESIISFVGKVTVSLRISIDFMVLDLTIAKVDLKDAPISSV